MGIQWPQISPHYRGDGFVVNAATFGGSDGTPRMLGGSLDATPQIFDLGTDDNGGTVVTGGVVYCGSEEIEVDEITISDSFSGSVYVKIECSDGDFEGSLVTAEPSSSETVFYRKLYDMTDGAITLDYRCAPVFVLYN